MENQSKFLSNHLGFNFYKDNASKNNEMISKKRKLSLNSQSSDSTKEKLELNESFKRLDIRSTNVSGLQTSPQVKKSISIKIQNSISPPPNYQRIPQPIKPTPRHPLQNTLIIEQLGIQKYLSLDNEQKMNDILYHQKPLLQNMTTINEILGKRETRSFHSSDQESEKEVEKEQGISKLPLVKKAEFQKRIFYPYGIPANLHLLIKASEDDLKKKIQEETQKLNQKQIDDKLEEILIKQNNPNFIGKLNKEERAEKVRQYLQKKRNRTWQAIRYQVRKNLAENRERVQGRFIKSNNKVQFNLSIGLPETNNSGLSQPMSQSWEGVSDKKIEKDQRKFITNFVKTNYEFNHST